MSNTLVDGINAIQHNFDLLKSGKAGRVEPNSNDVNINIFQLLRNIDTNIARLTNALAPVPLYSTMVFSGLGTVSPNNIVPPANCRLNGGFYNSIIATVTGIGAQINVYLNAADPNSQPPDFTFFSGFPTAILHFPSSRIEVVTIASVGTGSASGKVILMSY